MQRIEVEAIAPLVEQGNGAYASFGWIGGLTRWWTVKDGVTRLAVEPTGRSGLRITRTFVDDLGDRDPWSETVVETWPDGARRDARMRDVMREGVQIFAIPRLCCSFCGKASTEVKKLIAGPSVYICDECVALCNEILAVQT